MRVLVIGGGGREHALVWKLCQSARVSAMWCAPGNAGIAEETLKDSGAAVECVDLAASNLDGLLAFARENRVDFTVVGPDDPLGAGIVDQFQAAGLRIWGPNRKAARFEASKAFSQDFMERNGIPTARSGIFTEGQAAQTFAESLDGRCAVKADGLALGKGVLICQDRASAGEAIRSMLEERRFGEAGARVVIQELLEGTEISLHALCDGRNHILFPTAQDHKRARDGDQGPNTGGMGTYSPAPFLSESELQAVAGAVMEPWHAGCAAEGIDFRGMLYPGIMLTAKGPRVLEFNARFGDPETQVYLPRLETDLLDLLERSEAGNLEPEAVRWSSSPAICVVMASGGYPDAYEKGREITGLNVVAEWPDVKVFHAGTRREAGKVVTNGGRVLGVTAWGGSLATARKRAYEAVSQIQFADAQWRTDIAGQAL